MQNDQSSSSKQNASNVPTQLLSIQEPKDYIEQYIVKNSPYTKFKYNSVIYSIGDCLRIKDSDDTFSIAELIKIIPTNGIESIPFWPSIQVQWYYKKSEIDWKKNKVEALIIDSLSEYEIFKSKHQDIIFTETVLGKCEVLTIEEYQKQEENTDITFFTRAKYDPYTQLLTPPVSQWERACSCNNPVNPDLLYIKCDNCEKWFHPPCEGITNEKAKTIDQFYCKFCNKSLKKDQ